MKKSFKFLLIFLSAIMALCLSFAVACGAGDGGASGALSPDVTDAQTNGNDDDLNNPDGEQDGGDKGGQDGTTEDQGSEGDGNSDDANQGGIQNGVHNRPKPNATAVIMSSLEKLIKEPAIFEVSLSGASTAAATADTTDGGDTTPKSLTGYIYIDLHSQGTIGGISLENAEIRAEFGDINLWVKDERVYAAMGDIKISLTLDEIISLFGAATPAASVDTDILTLLTDGEFTSDGSTAQIKTTVELSGVEIPLLMDFEAGSRNTWSIAGISTEISLPELQLGVQLKSSQAAAPEALTDPESFVGLGNAAFDLAEIFTSQYLKASVEYSHESGLSLDGEVSLNTATLEVSGEFNVTYGDFSKSFGAIYKNGLVYISVDGVKVKASTDKIIEAVKFFLPEKLSSAGNPDLELEGLLKKVLGLNLDDYLSVSAYGESGFSALLHGTQLLSAFGVEFGLGDINLTVADGEISASALGVNLKLGKGERFNAEVDGYCDISGLIEKIPEVAEAGAVSFTGGAAVSYNQSDIALTLNKGIISWKNGVAAYFDMTVNSGDSAHDITVLITESHVQIAYGEVGVDVVYSEFPVLEQKLFEAYNRIRELVGDVAGENNPLPELNGMGDIAALLKDLAATSALAGEFADSFENFDAAEILQGIKLGASEKKNGIMALTFGAFSVDVINDQAAQNGLLGLEIGVEKGNLSLTADLHADVFTEEIPEMPAEISYLGMSEFAELADYAVAAVNTLCQNNVTLNFKGSVQGKYSDISAKLTYHSPNGFPITLNLEGKSVVLDPQTYVTFNLTLVPEDVNSDSLYLTVTIIDGVMSDGKLVTDGILDFYVSVSRFGTPENATEAQSAYKPLYFHAPADEILTLLSGALVAAGVDNTFINDFFITKWITSLETKAQLEACGNALMPLLGGILGGVRGGENVEAIAEENSLFDLADLDNVRRGFIKKLACGENTFEIVVDTGAPDGKLFTLTLGKISTGEGEEVISLFGSVSFDYGEGKVKGELTASYDEVTPIDIEIEDMYDFTGADELLLSLANSVTHPVGGEIISGEEAQHEYVINNYYYIDGTISASLFGIVEVKIDLVAISVTVDEDGIPAINLRLEYQGLTALAGEVIAISGDSALDITIKDGMVYMKRVQKTAYTWILTNIERDLENPITLYRAMPLDNFFGDILNQLGFILNFSDWINEQISKSTGDTGNTGGGNSQPETVAVKDYGTMVGEVLTDYIYSNSESGVASWTLKLNGSSFSNGILGDFTITLGENKEGYIKKLNLTDCQIIPVKGLTITAGLELTWHNPGGVSDGTKDATVDVGDILADPEYGMGAMIEKLNAENGWAEQTFIEGKEVTVKYIQNNADGGTTELGTQTVIVSTGNDGLTANMLLSSLVYPETAENDEFHYDEWDKHFGFEDIVPSDGIINISTNQHRKKYNVTFYSVDEVKGWSTGDDGRYYYSLEMEYGAKIEFIDLGETVEDFIIKGEVEIKVPDTSIGWEVIALNEKGATFNALHAPDTVHYHSEIEFELDGATSQDHSVEFTASTYTLITPEKEGYIFLGWFKQTENGWEKVDTLEKTPEGTTINVEALWAKVAGVGLSVNKSSKTYTANATLNEIIFFGAMKEEVTRQSVEYKFTFKGKNFWNSDRSSEFTPSNSYSIATGSYANASVEVKAVYKIGEYEFDFTQNSGEVKFN